LSFLNCIDFGTLLCHGKFSKTSLGFSATLWTSNWDKNCGLCEGIVLGRYGGTMKQLYMPFFVGVGGRISSGQQWFPWIHADDVAEIYFHAVTNDTVTVIGCFSTY